VVAETEKSIAAAGSNVAVTVLSLFISTEQGLALLHTPVRLKPTKVEVGVDVPFNTTVVPDVKVALQMVGPLVL